jgi:hypothetical protein
MREIDERLQRWTTEAYLWLLDWTGVYVGTLLFVVMVVDCVFSWPIMERSNAGKTFDLIVSVLLPSSTWLRQSRGPRVFNVEALWWRGCVARSALLLVLVVSVILGAAQLNWQKIAWWIPCFAMVYLMGVLIRDREPREFRLGRRAATEGAT